MLAMAQKTIWNIFFSGGGGGGGVWGVIGVNHRVPFYPRPILAFGYSRCLRLPVCVAVRVRQPLACPRDNSWPVSARITKFGP